MTYDRLKEMMQAYRLELITKTEMALAIGLWQLKTYGRVAS